MLIRPKKMVHYALQEKSVCFKAVNGTVEASFYGKDCVFVRFSVDNVLQNPAITAEPDLLGVELDIDESDDAVTIKRNALSVAFNKNTCQLSLSRGDVALHTVDYYLEIKTILDFAVYGSKAVFSSDAEEAFYGLGQQQTNTLNYAGKRVNVYHDYKAAGGESIGIPFMVSSRRYGLIWNNLSQSIAEPACGQHTTWQADATKDVSFFVLFGDHFDDIYQQYRYLTGTTPLPLKSALGYIQCKQRYETQQEIVEVATAYREKQYPCDMMVVDWFYWKELGDMDFNEAYWPDPTGMNESLRKMDFDTMISVWPRFMRASKHYAYLEEQGWFMMDTNGETLYGTEDDQRGALIDTTNPDCAKWYWRTIEQSLASKGFNAWWTDENEPDLWPYRYQLHLGKGFEIFNLYPYTHCRGVYEGHRQSLPERCTILSRSAYLGAQQFGTLFWSSDVYPTWGVLRRQLPAALNFCATGMAYWSSDIGGWQALPDYKGRSEFGTELLLETRGSDEGVVNSAEYPELYIRWFQFSVFCPIFRAHGTRDENEVWSYGPEAEKILVKFLRLRYQLMPYIYSLAYTVTQTGAPFMRALFLDFDEPAVKDIKDQYMFGPSLLIAPIVTQGAVKRSVYLPEGTRWYDFWTHAVYSGGQTLEVEAPLDSMPIFVREGSIVPFGKPVSSTKEAQALARIRVYSGRDAAFTLYHDDGRTYAYESGDYRLTQLSWHENSRAFTMDGTCEAPFPIEII